MAGDDVTVEVQPEAAVPDIEEGKINAASASGSTVEGATTSAGATGSAATAATAGSAAQQQAQAQAWPGAGRWRRAGVRAGLRGGGRRGVGGRAGAAAGAGAGLGGQEEGPKVEGEDVKEEATATAIRRSSLFIRILQVWIYKDASFRLCIAGSWGRSYATHISSSSLSARSECPTQSP